VKSEEFELELQIFHNIKPEFDENSSIKFAVLSFLFTTQTIEYDTDIEELTPVFFENFDVSKTDGVTFNMNMTQALEGYVFN
jgi:hypothetical protein